MQSSSSEVWLLLLVSDSEPSSTFASATLLQGVKWRVTPRALGRAPFLCTPFLLSCTNDDGYIISRKFVTIYWALMRVKGPQSYWLITRTWWSGLINQVCRLINFFPPSCLTLNCPVITAVYTMWVSVVAKAAGYGPTCSVLVWNSLSSSSVRGRKLSSFSGYSCQPMAFSNLGTYKSHLLSSLCVWVCVLGRISAGVLTGALPPRSWTSVRCRSH